MVQKQAALSGGYRADSFADDDPLAELARIVGFEQPRPGQRTAPESEPQSAGHGFNLEDELLREFETFEVPAPKAAPAPAPVAQRAVSAAVMEAPVAPAVVVAAPEPVVAPSRSEATAPAILDEPFDWAEELAQAEFYDALPAVTQPAARVEPAYLPQQEVEIRQEPEFTTESADDLADELELAFGGSDLGAPEPAWSPAPAVVPRISLPLANFQAKPAPRLEPDFGPDFVEPGQEAEDGPEFTDAPALSERTDRTFAVERDQVEHQADDAWLDFGADAPAEQPAMPEAEVVDYFPDFDFGSPKAVPARAEDNLAARAAEPDFSFSFADELAASEEVAPVIETPVVRRPEPDAFIQPRPTAIVERAPVAAVEPVAAKPAPALARDSDVMSDGEFELMLDDLDLDLSELDFVEPKPSAPAPIATASFSPVQARQEPVMNVAPSFAQPVRTPYGMETIAPATNNSVLAARFPAINKPMASAEEFDFRLPFDPDEIVDQEEQPESIALMDVPDMVYSEPKEPAPRRAEFDYDIDTELAGLFESPAAAPVAAAVAQTVTSGAAATAKPAAADDFDAFERALEEDFRRTLQNPGEGKLPPAGRISLDQVATKRTGSGRSLLLALAASVVLVGAAAAGGAYFWLGGSTSETAASGEPRVIMADKEPVKVVPENPGGKAVPNQDKAVYDRVAGAAVADPKQASLISTNEEPVDVVQRTLLPDNLPLEGESEGEVDSMATPVGETSDPRLLPEGQQTADGSGATEAEQSAIAPRKVRTMIVKPDGTLVAQEVPAAVPMATMPAAVPTPAAAETTGRSAASAASTPNVPATPAPSVNAAAPAAAPAGASPTPAELAAASATLAPVEAPAAETPAPAAAANAPVPTARPAEQPVNVVGRVTDQGNVTTARNTAPAAPAAAAQAPAAAQPASAPAASSVPPGSYVIQIASLPSEADAQASYRNLSSKFASVIGGRGVDIKAAEIAGKGTYYRVRIPAGTKAEAEALCGRFKAAGGSCLVVR